MGIIKKKNCLYNDSLFIQPPVFKTGAKLTSNVIKCYLFNVKSQFL